MIRKVPRFERIALDILYIDERCLHWPNMYIQSAIDAINTSSYDCGKLSEEFMIIASARTDAILHDNQLKNRFKGPV